MPDLPRILIIGVGSIGERHLRCFQKTGRCDLALCEPLEERRNDVARRYGVSGYASWEEALDAEQISAAVVASPAPFHVPTALGLAERGVHLLVEKPLSLSLDGIADLTTLVAEKQLKTAVGFVFRALPALREMQQAVASQRFGRPVQIHIQAGQNFPFYRPAYREVYYARHDMGGGAIQDMLPHQVNVAEWMVGPVTRAMADAAHQVLEGVSVEDTVNVLTRHGEVMGSVSLNQYQPPNEFTLTVVCERGAARWELAGQRWLSAQENGGEWKQEGAYQHERDDYYVLQAEGFLDQLEGKAEPLCSLEDGIQTLRAILAIRRSAAAGNWAEV